MLRTGLALARFNAACATGGSIRVTDLRRLVRAVEETRQEYGMLPPDLAANPGVPTNQEGRDAMAVRAAEVAELWNNLLLAIFALAAVALWVHGAMRARHVTLLAGLLSVIDVMAWSTGTMPALATRVRETAFAPQVMIHHPILLSLGLGDLLTMVLWTCVAGRAFGRRAEVTAGAGMLAALAAILLLNTGGFPALAVFAPVILVQYTIFRRFLGPERTMLAWYREEPSAARAAGLVPD